MTDGAEMFHRATGRSFKGFSAEEEGEWKGPFYFVQAADPQLGLMKAWAIGDTDNGGDEWEQEVLLTEKAIQAVNRLTPLPRFMAICGDLIHAMPGVKAVFSGHCHRNAGGVHDGVDMVVTSAVGQQLGDDTHGLRIVVVTEEKVAHQYYSLDELRDGGMGSEMRELLGATLS
uniref:Calcineurin-like phosphoesterase domain containing 1 n=1 Tax=Erpetoichthys calabaricus TaxID=27687 RepID=A0A8C4SZ45_ERPCA